MLFSVRAEHLFARAVLLLAALCAAVDVAAQSSLTPVTTPAFGGTIKQIRRVGDTLYLAGSFLGASPRELARGGLSIHDSSSSLRSVETPYVRGNLVAIVPSGTGGYYLGGDFHAVGSSVRQGLARILSDGSLDPVFAATLLEVPGFGGRVQALALAGSTLFVGGQLRTLLGQARSGLAALNAATGETLPLSFDLQFSTGGFGWVTGLAVAGNTLYVRGFFDKVGDQPRNGLAAFDINTGALSPWNPGLGPVGAFTIVGGTMYTEGSGSLGLQAVDLASGTIRPFGPFFSGEHGVTCLRAIGGALIVGGLFDGFFGASTQPVQSRRNLAALDLASGGLLPWAPNVSETVETIAVAGNTLFIGGGFVRVDGVDRAGVAAFDWGSGGALVPFNPSMNGSVFTIAADGPRVVMGGEFTGPFAQGRRSVAAIDARTGQLVAWQAADVRGPVGAMAITAGRIFLGGNSGDYTGNGRFLVALDLASGAVVPFPASLDGPVAVLEARDGEIYAGGLFSGVGTADQQHFAAFNANGTLLPLVANVSSLRALAVSNTQVFIGGTFQSVNNTARSGIAALDRTTGTLGSLSLPVVGGVTALALDGPTLYTNPVAGIVSPTGEVRRVLAAVDTTTGNLTAWNPGATWSKPAIPSLIAAYGGQVVVAGSGVIPPAGVAFGYVAGISADGVVSGTNLADLFGGTIDALLLDDQILAVGGSFGFLGADIAPGLVLFRTAAGSGQSVERKE